MEPNEPKVENLQVKRKLASIQKVDDILPIESDPQKEIAKILGWQVVVDKDEYKKEDIVVYFEIDSKLPDDRWCEDMAFYDFRVNTVTVAGVLSQGMIKHISTFKNFEKKNIGDDVTEELDVTKYDEEERSTSIIENKEFPIHLMPFTDEPRVQSEPKYLKLFEGKPYVGTLKYDGSSCSFILNPENKEDLWVCSRNKIVDPKKKNDFWKIAEKYKIKEKLQKFPDYAIQGEMYGPGIQKNLLGMKELKFAVFNVYSSSQKRGLDYDELVKVCTDMDLPYVAVIDRGDSFKYTMDDLFALVKGNYEGTNNQREGIVFRLAKNWYGQNSRASFKIISNDFLLK